MENLNSLRGVKVIGGDNAAIRVVDGTDTEIFFLSLPSGPSDLSQYHPLTEAGIVELSDCIVVGSPAGKIRLIKSEERFDTAANPDFQVSAATRQEMSMRGMMQRVLDANMARFAPARAKAAAAKDETEVIEENSDGTTEPSAASEQEDPAGGKPQEATPAPAK